MQKIFANADAEVSKEQVQGWLKKDDEAGFINLHDIMLSSYLNGLITHFRGKRDGAQPQPEKKLTNNLILRKLKIALAYQDTDMIEVLALADIRISKGELSAFFRKPDHRHYRECKDQFLRNFLNGLQIKQRA